MGHTCIESTRKSKLNESLEEQITSLYLYAFIQIESYLYISKVSKHI